MNSRVVVLGSTERAYGLLVDGLLGERELVVQPLDTRLGKIQDISAGSLMEDGSPVLIIDIDDIMRSLEKLAAAGTLDNFANNSEVGLQRQAQASVGGGRFIHRTRARAQACWRTAATKSR